jgi:hypothetical protein
MNNGRIYTKEDYYKFIKVFDTMLKKQKEKELINKKLARIL